MSSARENGRAHPEEPAPTAVPQLSRRMLAGVPILIVVGMSVLIVVAAYFGNAAAGYPISFPRAIRATLDWFVWLAFVPLVVWLSVRLSVRRLGWLGWLGVHIPLGVGVALVELLTFSVLARAITGPTESFPTLWRNYVYNLGNWLPYALLVYWVIVLGRELLTLWTDHHRGMLEAARLEEKLARAELGALQMQLHPHFMANTLHTVAIYLREGRTDGAVRIVEHLGELFNRSLEGTRRPDVSLGEEVEFARNYLEIEQFRFCDRLRVEMDVDASLRSMRVPSMILQPLLENAVRHGMRGVETPTRIRVEARRAGRHLTLVVRDDGPGFAATNGGNGRGVGLANVRERLHVLYGANAELRIETPAGGGAEVTLRIPVSDAP